MKSNNTESQNQTTATRQPSKEQASSETQNYQDSPGFWSTVKSVLGAMIGVQSDAQREKDFQSADPVKLILGGIIFTVVFILTILWFVGKALESAGQ